LPKTANKIMVVRETAHGSGQGVTQRASSCAIAEETTREKKAPPSNKMSRLILQKLTRIRLGIGQVFKATPFGHALGGDINMVSPISQGGERRGF